MWTIVEINELVWVLLWNGEIFGQLYWNLEEAEAAIVRWWHGTL